MLSSKSFIVLFSYIWIFDTFLVNFYVWRKVRVKLYSFAGKYPVAPAPFVETTILCPLTGLGTLVENQLTTDTWFYFSLLSSIPLIGMSTLMSVPLLCNKF